MKTSCSKRFTLIELLVVIAIIGILAGLVFPALGTVRNNAKKSKASSECQSMKTAIIMYESEFSRWPADGTGDARVNSQDDTSNSKTESRDTSNYPNMCEALTGSNKKKMIFYEVGVGYEKNKGFLDPWNRQYQVVLDFDYSGTINEEHVRQINSGLGRGTSTLNTSVAVYSYGVDGDNKNKTDLTTLAQKKKIVISW